ncbi:hypothetical protein Q1695_011784 [Nippostrongylus brasiliensis]|nr:hypothetical protein Q1695_011784 [Nippostrongylus brasiliensis]
MDNSVILPVLEVVVLPLLWDEGRAYVNDTHVPNLDTQFTIVNAYSKLHSKAFLTPTASTWANAVQEFRRQWDYPAAMRALDGKHVSCVEHHDDRWMLWFP